MSLYREQARVLVVDTNHGIRRLVEMVFSDHGHLVIPLGCYGQAIRLMPEIVADLGINTLVSEHNIGSGGTGEDLASVIRTARLPIQVFSFSEHHGITWGDGNIEKGGNLDELMAAVTQGLNGLSHAHLSNRHLAVAS